MYTYLFILYLFSKEMIIRFPIDCPFSAFPAADFEKKLTCSIRWISFRSKFVREVERRYNDTIIISLGQLRDFWDHGIYVKGFLGRRAPLDYYSTRNGPESRRTTRTAGASRAETQRRILIAITVMTKMRVTKKKKWK